MNPPDIHIEPNALSGDSFQDARTVAANVVRKLGVHPHFVLLRGLQLTARDRLIQQVTRVIADMPPIKETVAPDRRAKISMTRVHIDPEKTLPRKGATNYSRTSEALELHSDSSYLPHPHELVAFQMVRADAKGGDTLMAPAEDVISRLGADTLEALAQPTFPFGRGRFPILWWNAGDPRIRYYRNQIEFAIDNGDELGTDERTAMEQLDAAIAEVGISHRFRIETGETLFMRNVKVLHGRTGFAPDSRRFMYRFRAHAGCLG